MDNTKRYPLRLTEKEIRVLVDCLICAARPNIEQGQRIDILQVVIIICRIKHADKKTVTKKLRQRDSIKQIPCRTNHNSPKNDFSRLKRMTQKHIDIIPIK